MKQLLAVLMLSSIGGTSCLFPVQDLSLGALSGSGATDGGDDGGTGGGAGGGFVADPADGVCTSIALVNPGPPARPLGSTGCYCTRRDAVPAGTCPRGLGQSASAMIGPAGGELVLIGQQGMASGIGFKLVFPPTAVSTPTLITVTETTLALPAGSVDYSPVYRIEPVGLVLAEPAALTLPWSNGPIYGVPRVFWSATSLCNLEVLPSSYFNAGVNNGSIIRLGYAMTGYAEAGTAAACQ